MLLDRACGLAGKIAFNLDSLVVKSMMLVLHGCSINVVIPVVCSTRIKVVYILITSYKICTMINKLLLYLNKDLYGFYHFQLHDDTVTVALDL
jgi:hypothetical protein